MNNRVAMTKFFSKPLWLTTRKQKLLLGPVSLALILSSTAAGQGAAKRQTRNVGAKSGRETVAKPAQIEGDVYLVNKGGDIKKGAGRSIRLLNDTDAMRQRLAAACEGARPRPALLVAMEQDLLASARQLTNQRKADSIQKAIDDREGKQKSVIKTVSAILDSATAQTTTTGMEAHYRFQSVPPGKYVVYGEMALGDLAYEWWAPVELKAGEIRRRDLDNSVEADDRLYCRLRRPIELP